MSEDARSGEFLVIMLCRANVSRYNARIEFLTIFATYTNILNIFLNIIFKVFMVFCFVQTDTVLVTSFYHQNNHQHQQKQQHTNIHKVNTKINDPIFGARCDIKCWNQSTNDKLQCRIRCLQDKWVKPGICAPKEATSAPSLERACINTCTVDSECSGILKCCQHSCGVTCQTPLTLDSISGVPPLPENVIVDINTDNQFQDDIVMVVYWSTQNTTETSAYGKILYLVEERHHIGKQFIEERLSDWVIRRRCTSVRNKVSIKNLYKAGRWYQFRITAINENGTRGPSQPSKPFFSSIISAKAPDMPQNLRIGATSWGHGRLHLQLTWQTPSSDLPIYRYKVTASRLKNFTLIQHHHTLPPSTTYFWLKDSVPNTEYFLQVQAFSKFGKRRLPGEIASIVFNTADHKHIARSSIMSDTSNNRHGKVKYKRSIQNLKVERLYWLRDQLLARIGWAGIRRPRIYYSITWSHNGCRDTTKAWYIAKTDMTNFEVYDLQPGCEYTVSVKATWHQTLFMKKTVINTSNCERDNTTLTNNIIVECVLPTIL